MTTLHSQLFKSGSILCSFLLDPDFGVPFCISFVLWYIVSSIATAFKPGLKSIPGPAIARFSSFYRPWKISKGDAPDFYLRLHDEYGKIVRTLPNTVDISDPEALPIIYGISSRFLKVGFIFDHGKSGNEANIDYLSSHPLTTH